MECLLGVATGWRMCMHGGARALLLVDAAEKGRARLPRIMDVKVAMAALSFNAKLTRFMASLEGGANDHTKLFMKSHCVCAT